MRTRHSPYKVCFEEGHLGGREGEPCGLRKGEIAIFGIREGSTKIKGENQFIVTRRRSVGSARSGVCCVERIMFFNEILGRIGT